MTEPERIKRDIIQAPYAKEIRLEELRFESGMRLLRTTIREGRRFTTLDLDPRAAELWSNAMRDWLRDVERGD